MGDRDETPVPNGDVSNPSSESTVRVHPDGSRTPETFEHAVAAARQSDLGERGDAMNEMAHAATLPQEEDVEVGCAHCQRCEVIPRRLVGPGTLMVNLPHTHTIGKVLRWLRASGLEFSESSGTVRIEVAAGSLAPVVTPLNEVLSPTERGLTRVVFQPAGMPMREADYFRIEDIGTFSARAGSDWLLDLLREKRLTSYFQPIVAVADGRTVLGHECLLRGRSEEGPISPKTIFETARRSDLTFQVDQSARRMALRCASAVGMEGKVFVNFTPDSIFDAAYCLDATVRLVDELGFAHSRVVFEVVESERLPEVEHLRSIIDYYRERDFGVALDDVGAGYSSLAVLLAIRPDYAKIDMELVRGVHLDPAKAMMAGHLVQTIRDLGAKSVVEGVETKEEWAWAKDAGADYAQGFLFGRPKPALTRR